MTRTMSPLHHVILFILEFSEQSSDSFKEELVLSCKPRKIPTSAKIMPSDSKLEIANIFWGLTTTSKVMTRPRPPAKSQRRKT